MDRNQRALNRQRLASGRPGRKILKDAREGGGTVWGSETYKNIIDLMTGHGGSNYFVGVDETYTLAKMMTGMYSGFEFVARTIIDSVRNENGVDVKGHNINLSLEDFAGSIVKDADFSQAVLFDMTLGGTYLPFLDRLKNSGEVTELEIVEDREMEDCYNSIRIKLGRFSDDGYVAATDAIGLLTNARDKYYSSVRDLRELILEAAKSFAM